MWLLSTENETLGEFVGRNIPKYAILSHTWQADEVTFQNIQDGTAKSKYGWPKVANTCRQAKRDGYAWVWIDTLCINKSSSAELSEAINSMYQWYAAAQICYVYLWDAKRAVEAYQDIDPGHEDETQRGFLTAQGNTYVDPRITHSYDHDFDRYEEEIYEDLALDECQWFTRGWTLQELIASKEMSFYGPKWEFLGTKRTLRGTLPKITKINLDVLRNPSEHLSRETIAARMSWAAGRRTTRIEDRAYSLLGILGTNLTLLYGEGSEAFVRLQEKLIRTCTDQSVFAWGRTRQSAREGLLARSPDDFENCHDVIHYSNGKSNSYHVTNKGLEIRLPLFQQPGDSAYEFGVLNCRIRDDSTGPLTLCLISVDRLPPFHSSEETSTYYVACSWGIRSSVKPLEATADAIQTPITIMKQATAKFQYITQTNGPQRARGKVWLQLTANFADEYSQKILSVKKLSNEIQNGHQVFRPGTDNEVFIRKELERTANSTRTHCHEAHAIWRLTRPTHDASTKEFGVALRLLVSTSDRTELRIAIFDPTNKKHLRQPNSGHYGLERWLHFALNNARASSLAETAQVAIPGWADVEVSSLTGERMGDTITIVQVSVNAPGSVVSSPDPSRAAMTYCISRHSGPTGFEQAVAQLQDSHSRWAPHQDALLDRVALSQPQPPVGNPVPTGPAKTRQTKTLDLKRTHESAFPRNVEDWVGLVPPKRGKAMPMQSSASQLDSIDVA